MAKTDKKKQRYSGVDSVPWVVVGQDGKRIAANESHEGFATAKVAAKRYTEATGLHAAAVRL